MHELERHEMTRVTVHESGAEEWHCPACGRRLVLSWPPHYRKVVLEAGDEYAQHAGARGGLSFTAAEVVETEDRILSPELRAALDELDIDGLFAQGD